MNYDRKLTGVVIDPGHGGSDSGAVGNDMLEKDYTLLISKYMYDRFKELGIPVTLTRDSDVSLDPTNRVNKILNAYGNNSDVIVISNHLNAGGGTGAEVIYALRNTDTLAKKVLESIGAEGQTTRKYYQRRLPSDTSKDYYFIHRNTGKTEPIIVEYGFIDDSNANVEFLKENYQRLAEAVIRAVADYKGFNYIPPEGFVSNSYTVQKGDTLYGIANKLGTTVDELKKLNNLTSNNLSIGQILKIPEKYVQEGEKNIYVVKKGDSLYSIARENNTTVSELKTINKLTSDVLTIGQTLLLPSATVIADTYTVQKGDTLYGIANKLGTTVSELKNTNNLTSDTLSIGQVLKIPNSNNEENSNTITYTVKSGDSLYSIAKNYDVTVDAIKKENNLTSNLLSIGQILKIPTTSITETTYVVKSGDNLYGIARKFNTTVDELKRLNNLTSNLLSIGQILIIE